MANNLFSSIENKINNSSITTKNSNRTSSSTNLFNSIENKTNPVNLNLFSSIGNNNYLTGLDSATNTITNSLNKTEDEDDKGYFSFDDPTQTNSFADLIYRAANIAINDLNTNRQTPSWNKWKNTHTTFWKKGFINPIQNKDWDKLLNNSLVNFGETVDIFANVVKAILPNTWTTAKDYPELTNATYEKNIGFWDKLTAATGITFNKRTNKNILNNADWYRYNFDMDFDFGSNTDGVIDALTNDTTVGQKALAVGETVANLVGEILADPLNWAEAIGSVATKIGASTATDIAQSSAKSISKHVVNSLDNNLDNITKKVVEQTDEVIKQIKIEKIVKSTQENFKFIKNSNIINPKAIDSNVLSTFLEKMIKDDSFILPKGIINDNDTLRSFLSRTIRSNLRTEQNPILKSLVSNTDFVDKISDKLIKEIVDVSNAKTSLVIAKGLASVGNAADRLDKGILALAGMPLATPAVLVAKYIGGGGAAFISRFIAENSKAYTLKNMYGEDVVKISKVDTARNALKGTLNKLGLTDEVPEDIFKEADEFLAETVNNTINKATTRIMTLINNNELSVEELAEEFQNILKEYDLGNNSIEHLVDYMKKNDVFAGMLTKDSLDLIQRAKALIDLSNKSNFSPKAIKKTLMDSFGFDFFDATGKSCNTKIIEAMDDLLDLVNERLDFINKTGINNKTLSFTKKQVHELSGKVDILKDILATNKDSFSNAIDYLKETYIDILNVMKDTVGKDNLQYIKRLDTNIHALEEVISSLTNLRKSILEDLNNINLFADFYYGFYEDNLIKKINKFVDAYNTLFAYSNGIEDLVMNIQKKNVFKKVYSVSNTPTAAMYRLIKKLEKSTLVANTEIADSRSINSINKRLLPNLQSKAKSILHDTGLEELLDETTGNVKVFKSIQEAQESSLYSLIDFSLKNNSNEEFKYNDLYYINDYIKELYNDVKVLFSIATNKVNDDINVSGFRILLNKTENALNNISERIKDLRNVAPNFSKEHLRFETIPYIKSLMNSALESSSKLNDVFSKETPSNIREIIIKILDESSAEASEKVYKELLIKDTLDTFDEIIPVLEIAWTSGTNKIPVPGSLKILSDISNAKDLLNTTLDPKSLNDIAKELDESFSLFKKHYDFKSAAGNNPFYDVKPYQILENKFRTALDTLQHLDERLYSFTKDEIGEILYTKFYKGTAEFYEEKLESVSDLLKEFSTYKKELELNELNEFAQIELRTQSSFMTQQLIYGEHIQYLENLLDPTTDLGRMFEIALADGRISNSDGLKDVISALRDYIDIVHYRREQYAVIARCGLSEKTQNILKQALENFALNDSSFIRNKYHQNSIIRSLTIAGDAASSRKLSIDTFRRTITVNDDTYKRLIEKYGEAGASAIANGHNALEDILMTEAYAVRELDEVLPQLEDAWVYDIETLLRSSLEEGAVKEVGNNPDNSFIHQLAVKKFNSDEGYLFYIPQYSSEAELAALKTNPKLKLIACEDEAALLNQSSDLLKANKVKNLAGFNNFNFDDDFVISRFKQLDPDAYIRSGFYEPFGSTYEFDIYQQLRKKDKKFYITKTEKNRLYYALDTLAELTEHSNQKKLMGGLKFSELKSNSKSLLEALEDSYLLDGEHTLDINHNVKNADWFKVNPELYGDDYSGAINDQLHKLDYSDDDSIVEDFLRNLGANDSEINAVKSGADFKIMDQEISGSDWYVQIHDALKNLNDRIEDFGAYDMDSLKLYDITKVDATNDVLEFASSRLGIEPEEFYKVLQSNSNLTDEELSDFISGFKNTKYSKADKVIYQNAVQHKVNQSFRKKSLYFALREDNESYTEFIKRISSDENLKYIYENIFAEGCEFKNFQQVFRNADGIQIFNYKNIYDPTMFTKESAASSTPFFVKLAGEEKYYSDDILSKIMQENKVLQRIAYQEIVDYDSIFTIGLFKNSLDLREVVSAIVDLAKNDQGLAKQYTDSWLRYINIEEVQNVEQLFAVFYSAVTDSLKTSSDLPMAVKEYLNTFISNKKYDADSLINIIKKQVFEKHQNDALQDIIDLGNPFIAWSDQVSSLEKVMRFSEVLESYPGAEAKRIVEGEVGNKAISLAYKIKNMSAADQIKFKRAFRTVYNNARDEASEKLLSNILNKKTGRDYLIRSLVAHGGVISFELPHGIADEDVIRNLLKDEKVSTYLDAMRYLKDNKTVEYLNKKGISVNIKDSKLYLSLDAKSSLNLDYLNNTFRYMGKQYDMVTPALFEFSEVLDESLLSKEDIDTLNEMYHYMSRNGSTPFGRAYTVSSYMDMFNYLPKEVQSNCVSPMTFLNAHYLDNYKCNTGTYSITGLRSLYDIEDPLNLTFDNYKYALQSNNMKDLTLDMLTGNDSVFSIKNPSGIFAHCSNDEIFEIYKKSKEAGMHWGYLVDESQSIGRESVQGYHFREFNMLSKNDVELARDLNVVVLPYQVYNSTFTNINNTLSHTFIDNFANKKAKLTKDILEGSGEFFDNSYKTIGQAEGEAVDAILRDQPKNLARAIMLSYKLGYLIYPATWVRNIIDSNLKASIDTGSPISIIHNNRWAFEQYKKYDEVLSQIAELNQDKNITTTVINKYFRTLEKAGKEAAMSQSEFFFIHGFDLNGPSAGMSADILKRVSKDGVAEEASSFYSKLGAVSNWALTPMQKIEATARLAQYKTLIDQGITKTDAFSRVSKTAFDYANKSRVDQMVENVIPFYTFQKLNFKYWLDVACNNPAIVRLLEDVSKAKYDSFDVTPEEVRRNKSLQYSILHGALALDSDSMFTLKLNSSYMDFFNLLSNPIESVFGNVFAPFQNAIELVQDSIDYKKSQEQLKDGTYPITFGKFKGYTLNELLTKERGYAQTIVQMPWMQENYPGLYNAMMQNLAGTPYVIPFGEKYKNQPVKILLEDDNRYYAQWLVGQDWFHELYKPIYDYLIANKIYEEPVMPNWGKYAGQKVSEVPQWYKNYMLSAVDDEGKQWFWEEYPRLAEYFVTGDFNCLTCEQVGTASVTTDSEINGMFASMVFKNDTDVKTNFGNILKAFALENSPILGTFYQKFLAEDSTSNNNFERLSENGDTVQAYLGKFLPGFFGAVKQYEDYKSESEFESVKYTSPYQDSWKDKSYNRGNYNYYRRNTNSNFYNAYRKHRRKTLDVAQLHLNIAQLHLI